MLEWPDEKLAKLTNEQLEALRENATKRGRQDIVAKCNEELGRRKPPRPRKRPDSVREDRRGRYVSEFHFICPSEKGITRNPDGTIWSGTWVVDEERVKNALKYDTLIALHSSRSELSYLQGTVRDWRKGPREPRYSGDQETQIREGIEFLFQPSESRLPWKGDATGEKGYAWKRYPESVAHTSTRAF